MATMLLTVLHWDQARSVLGLGGAADRQTKPKRRSPEPGYRPGILALMAALVAAPYAEELVRCLQACPNRWR